MMKKTITKWSMIILMISIGSNAYSQRHLIGSNFLEVGGGITKHGYYGNINYDKQLKAKLFSKVGLLGEFGNFKESKTKYQSYMLNVGGYYNILNAKHIYYLNAGGGLVGKFDNINAFEGSIKSSSINYGVFVGIDNEIFISDGLAITINAFQNFYFGKGKSVMAESKAFYVGLGLKFKI